MIIKKIQNQLRELLDLYGYVDVDSHLNRTVRRLPGTFSVFHDEDIREIMKLEFPLECIEDYQRMKDYLKITIDKVFKDRRSRQLVVSNMDDYVSVQPCFNLVQFLLTNRGEYDMYVYQRSHDIAKVYKDFAYFGAIAEEFEQSTKENVTKLVVIYGDLHEEKSN